MAEAMAHSKQARWLLGGLMMTAFLLAEMGRADDDDDDDGEREWRNIPRHVKARNLIVKIGDHQVTLPVAYGFGMFHSVGLAMSDLLHGVDSEKVASELAGAVFENFSVFGNPLVEKDGKIELRPGQMLPTIPKMVVAPSENLDGLGRGIAPEKYRASTPDSQNMTRALRHSTYSDAAAALNEMTGGNKYQAGMVDVSPNVLKYWVTSLLGGAGRFVGDTADMVMNAPDGVAPELENVPVARKFLRESDVSDSRAAFWHVAAQAKMAAQSYRTAVKDGDAEAGGRMLAEDKPYIMLAKMADKMGKLAGSHRNMIEAIGQNETLSAAEKKEAIKKVEEAEKKVYDNFLATFDAMEK